ncbi:hypothetical protein [Pyxidicoccus xibeiensis]|uniref:hypothetical protein n=1 Tax=Pyxidicoccus xibeiensis TaxID=2906759 RepID=UPI0020A7DEBE|nr:hypothetical protein [Pyxidicoccus xibeiensis]MCP3145335.1 hypothetical protein [Pyxidicoccus xibeiensis]
MRLPVAAALLALVACSRTTEGPTPRLVGVINPRTRNVTPPLVCNAQGGERGWRMEVSGEAFAPMPGDVLSDAPMAALPEVTLRGPTTLTLARERVAYVRPELLLVDLPTRDTTPPAELPEGSYSVEVTNPLGGTASLADALVVVAPPTLTRVVQPPGGYSFLEPSPLVIEGTHFRTNTFPVITLRRTDGPQQTLFVTAVVSSTRIETEVPPGTPEGRYDLVVTNPEGCAATLPQALDITYPKLGTLTVEPRSGSALTNQPITLTNAPTGSQLGFSGGVPRLFLVATLKKDPFFEQEIPLRDVTFVSPTQVTAVVPTCTGFEEPPATDPKCPDGIRFGGPYAIKVVDTNGAVGEVPASAGFTVVSDEAEGLMPEGGALELAPPPHGAPAP